MYHSMYDIQSHKQRASAKQELKSRMEDAFQGELWAQGLLVCSTGLHRPMKDDVASIITRAGGR
jgi:hypothetical protein